MNTTYKQAYERMKQLEREYNELAVARIYKEKELNQARKEWQETFLRPIEA